MRKITNKKGLSDAIMRAIQSDSYNKGDADYSISDLIKPPRILFLEKKHEDEIEVDASEMIWLLFGKAVHKIIEEANLQDVVERRLSWSFSGKKVSGAMDNYDPKTGLLTDYKTAAVSKFSFKDFSDWEAQQNCYAQLLRLHNEPIRKLEITAFIKDWRNKEAKVAELNGKPYPDKVEVVDLPLWSEEKSVAYIESRIKLHEDAKTLLPECAPDERWATAEVWAIKKRGTNRAINGGIFSNERDAQLNCPPGHEIEYRPGESRRCAGGWCPAAPFCSQWKKIKGEMK